MVQTLTDVYVYGVASSLISVSESAELLGISRARVHAMIANGTIRAEKIGHNWLIDRNEIARRKRQSQRRGRPLSCSTAWRSIRDAELPGEAQERDELRRRLRPRAHHEAVRAHSSVLVDLVHNPDVVLSGRHAADLHGLPAGADDSSLDAYVKQSFFDDLVDRGAVSVRSDAPNVRLHIIEDAAWAFEKSERFAPLIAVWLDLADADDRSERLVAEALLRYQRGDHR